MCSCRLFEDSNILSTMLETARTNTHTNTYTENHQSRDDLFLARAASLISDLSFIWKPSSSQWLVSVARLLWCLSRARSHRHFQAWPRRPTRLVSEDGSDCKSIICIVGYKVCSLENRRFLAKSATSFLQFPLNFSHQKLGLI